MRKYVSAPLSNLGHLIMIPAVKSVVSQLVRLLAHAHPQMCVCLHLASKTLPRRHEQGTMQNVTTRVTGQQSRTSSCWRCRLPNTMVSTNLCASRQASDDSRL